MHTSQRHSFIRNMFIRSTFMVPATLIALAGCGMPDEDAINDADSEHIVGPLYANSGRFWPGSPPVVPVCWENPSASTATKRGWVQHAVQSQWGRYGRLNFTGWGTCSTTSPGIHVLITNEFAATGDANGVSGYPWLDGGKYDANGNLTNGVHVDLNVACADYATNEHCIRALALHEFGHAIGFYHEEERPELTGDRCGNKSNYYNDKPLELGGYDLESVMSYKGQAAPKCAPSLTHPTTYWKNQLGAGDIAALQAAYGRRIKGQIVSMGGKCLGASSSANGARPSLSDCTEPGGAAGTQSWNNPNYSELVLRGTNTCLDVPSGNTTNSTQLQMWQCLHNSNQNFRFEKVAIRGWGGKCLDLPNGNLASGQTVQMYACLGEFADVNICPTAASGQPCRYPTDSGTRSNANQQWSFTSDGRIHFGASSSNWCLTYPSTSNGAQLYIAACGGSNQTFSWSDEQLFVGAAQSGKCVDVPAPLTSQYKSTRSGSTLLTNGTGVPVNYAIPTVYSCISNQLNQKWTITGALQFGGAAKVVNRDGNSETTGTIPTIYDRWSPLPRSETWDIW